MIASDARILASQTNGRKSKGPSTPGGKSISRANSLKHGMTGAGVVLPDEDVVEISKRFDELQGQFNPATPMGKILVHRVAMLSVRLERSAEQEAAYLSEKIRHAQDNYDQDRQIEVESLLGGIAKQPSLAVHKLLRTPDGIDGLIAAWDGLLDDLRREDLGCWTPAHNASAHHLMGRRAEEIPISRVQELSRAIWGDFSILGKQDGAGLDVEARRNWARERLIELIVEELAALRICRERLDLDAFEQDRAEAGKRALFDSSKPAVLARRYEAVNERGMFRALKELHKVEKEAAANPVQTRPNYPVGPLGSFCRESEVDLEEPETGSEPGSDNDFSTDSGANWVDNGGREGVVSRVALVN